MLFDRVKELCASKGVTIFKLERELGFANASISRWKTSYPSADRLKKVADYFGVSVDDLLDRNALRLSDESKRIAELFDKMPKDKQDLVRCYIGMIYPN